MNSLVHSSVTPSTLGVSDNGASIKYVDYENVEEVKPEGTANSASFSQDATQGPTIHFLCPDQLHPGSSRTSKTQVYQIAHIIVYLFIQLELRDKWKMKIPHHDQAFENSPTSWSFAEKE